MDKMDKTARRLWNIFQEGKRWTMLKSFATIIELDMASPDAKLIFAPRGGVWIASINEIVSNIFNSYFNDIIKINEAMLYSLSNIGSITVIDANSNSADRGYVEVFNFEDLYNQNKSYFQYKENGINYIAIHFNNFETIYTKKSIIINIKKLFSTREWLDNNNKLISVDKNSNMEIEPRIEEIDTADIEGDALAFSTVQTNEISITIRNDDGLFDDFINIYGNRLLVKRVFDYEDINNAVVIFSGFIEKPEYSFLDTVTITASDIRASFTAELPSNVFSVSKYTYLKSFPENVKSGEDIIDTARTLAAGNGVIVKLKPIKYYTPSILEPDNVPEVIFEICDTSKHAIDSIVNRTDPLDNNKSKPHIYFIEKAQSDSQIIVGGKTITGDLEQFIPEFKDYEDGKGSQRVWALDKERGQLIFRGDKQVRSICEGMGSASSQLSDELIEIYAEINIPPYKSLQFIREILEDYENISYISQNYNLENWQEEEARARDIAILLDNDNKKTVLDIVGEICFLEQGRLELYNNKINFISTRFRENNAKYKFKQWAMGRVDKTVESDEYLSSCSIKYDFNKSTYKNTDYEEEAKKRHRINSHEDFETWLKNKEDAIELSNEIMKSRYILKEYYTFEYYETLDFLKLFDIVEFEYKRDDNSYFIKPCLCEIIKLNIFDNVVKLRQL